MDVGRAADTALSKTRPSDAGSQVYGRAFITGFSASGQWCAKSDAVDAQRHSSLARSSSANSNAA